MTTTVNLNRRTFLVKLMWGMNSQFMVTEPKELVDILQNFDKGGVEFIKEYDSIKHKFSRVSKKEVLAVMSTEETKDYLTNHYFFK